MLTAFICIKLNMASTLSKVHTSQFKGDEVLLVVTTNSLLRKYSDLQWLVYLNNHTLLICLMRLFKRTEGLNVFS